MIRRRTTAMRARGAAFVVAVAMDAPALCGCGGTAQPGPAAPAAPATSVAPSTIAPAVNAPPTPAAPVGPAARVRPSEPCVGEGRFDLTAIVVDPRCAVDAQDPRIVAWRGSTAPEPAFVIRIVDADDAIHAPHEGEIAVRFEIENLGPDVELVRDVDGLVPRVDVRNADPAAQPHAATLSPKGNTFFPRSLAFRLRSHAIGTLVVRYGTLVETGSHCSQRSRSGMHVRLLDHGWLGPGLYALEAKPFRAAPGTAPAVGSVIIDDGGA